VRALARPCVDTLWRGGADPSTEATHGRAFAEDLPTRALNPSEAQVLSVAIKPEVGRSFCSTWDVADFEGKPITVGFVARVLLESDDGGPDQLICRAMNWRRIRVPIP